MPIVTFRGKVLPAALNLTLGIVPFITTEPGTDGAITFTLSITNGIIQVDCDVDRYDPEMFKEIFAAAANLAKTCIALAGFSTGLGLTVHLDSVVEPGEEEQPIVMQNKELAQACSAYEFLTTTDQGHALFGTVLGIIISEPSLYTCMQDLNQVLSQQGYVPINCGRVLDGLRKFVSSDLEPKKGWPVLQGIVNADAAYMRFISDHSTNPRHGDPSPVPPEIVDEIAVRTWRIMNRFIEYKKRGGLSLPLAEFPTLVG